MTERKLEVLRFSIVNKEDKCVKLNMSKIDKIDLLEYIYTSFVPFIEKLPLDERSKRIVQLGKKSDSSIYFHKKTDFRSISGILETGIYGKEENVIDIDKKDDIPVFKIKKNHAVQKPFYFLICVPEIKEDGLIILERDGHYGIKTVFTLLFSRFIQQNFEGFEINFTNFIDDEIIKNYINDGEYKQIQLTRNSLPEDVADRYGLEKFETDDFVVELTIRSKGKRKIKGNARKQIIELFEDKPNGFFSSEVFAKMGFDESAIIKVKSTYLNSTRTIDLSDTMRFKPYYNIFVELNEAEQSDFTSIESEAIKLINDFKLDLY